LLAYLLEWLPETQPHSRSPGNDAPMSVKVVSAKKTKVLRRVIHRLMFADEFLIRLNRKYNFEVLERHQADRMDVTEIVAREKGWRGKTILIECKAKEKITLKDFLHFNKRFDDYYERNSRIIGIFAYRGKLDHAIKDYIERSKVPIYLEPFR
jgi:hypothetical protein